MQMTDGTVMVHEYNTPNWWRLSPDNKGSFLNGTWSKLGSMPSNYAPLYFASAVLADGRVLVEGGEYNFLSQDETNLGAIYNPVTNKWNAMQPPDGWANVGDAAATVLPSGRFLMGNLFTSASALLDPKTLKWTPTGAGKQDRFAEEGMTLLPDGTVLIVDALAAPNAEKYYKGQWISAGNTIVRLEDPGSQEIGPAVLRPDGTVFATGGNASGGGHTSIYTMPSVATDPGTWTVGPDIPDGNNMADAPASLLPNGHVIVQTSPGIFHPPSTFYEFDGAAFTKVTGPRSASNTTSYQGRMLVLPTGQVLYLVADGSTIDVEIYSTPGTADRSWAPKITAVPNTLTHGNSYVISGTQFNGLSQGAMYGDDGQMSTNYPLVRITNNASGHVFYARTHGHSNMGVATGSVKVSTHFDVPASIETGASKLVVVANGIASNPVAVTIQ
jgi:hypothetical protein